MQILQIAEILNREIALNGYSIKQIAQKSGHGEQTIRNIINAAYSNVGLQTLTNVCNTIGFNVKIELVKSK